MSKVRRMKNFEAFLPPLGCTVISFGGSQKGVTWSGHWNIKGNCQNSVPL